MKEKVFISYNREDSAFVIKLLNDLTSRGVNTWMDTRDIAPDNQSNSIYYSTNDNFS